VIALIAGVYFFQTGVDPWIATITSIDGAIRWTGDGGQVLEDLQEGQALTGGTIESHSVDSSVKLRFVDGSTISISGATALTVSDGGQKKLLLRYGSLSVSVEKQPEDRPVVVLTPTARFEVLGTRFDLMADPEHSKVSVKEGLVRVVRLSDGKSVKVPADHSAIADITSAGELVSERVDQAVHV